MLSILIFLDGVLEFLVDSGRGEGFLARGHELGNFLLGFDTELGILDFLFDFGDHLVAVDTEIAEVGTVADVERVDLDVEGHELGVHEGLVRVDVLEGVANLDTLLFGVLPGVFDGVASVLQTLVSDELDLGLVELRLVRLACVDKRFESTLGGGGLGVEFVELRLELTGVDEHVFGGLDVLGSLLVVLPADFLNLVLGGDEAFDAALCLTGEDAEDIELHGCFSFCLRFMFYYAIKYSKTLFGRKPFSEINI